MSDPFDIRTEETVKDGLLIVHKMQDVEPYLERCKALRNAEPGKFEKKGDVRTRAEVPMTVIMEMLQKLGIPISKMFRLDKDERKRMLKMLKTDYPGFLTSSAKW